MRIRSSLQPRESPSLRVTWLEGERERLLQTLYRGTAAGGPLCEKDVLLFVTVAQGRLDCLEQVRGIEGFI